MKKLFVFLFTFSCSLAVLAQTTVVKDPNAVLRFTGERFSAIEVGGAVDVYLSQGTTTAVAVSANEADQLQYLKTEVQNGVLKIGLDGNAWKEWKNKNPRFRVYVSTTEINKLKVGGACNVKIDGELKSKTLDINLSGATDLTGHLTTETLVLNLSGASDIKLTGIANQLIMEASGASDCKSIDLKTDYAKIKASGASSIRLTVNKTLEVDASGASDILYKGDGFIKEVKSSGASKVKRVEK